MEVGSAFQIASGEKTQGKAACPFGDVRLKSSMKPAVREELVLRLDNKRRIFGREVGGSDESRKVPTRQSAAWARESSKRGALEPEACNFGFKKRETWERKK